jgi:hypothetical protein
MGHIGVKGLRHAVEGVDFDDSDHASCIVCARANIKRTPFPQQAQHRATRPLERIHCDVCGPLPTCFGGFKYFILFICCYSRYISVYFLQSRDEAAQYFGDFKSLVENFCGTKIITLRVDNAPELIHGKFKHLCKAAGITYEKTVPDSPNQNGVAERCNLTLASMARALLIDADLSDWFWPFAIQTAVHIKNRVPHSSLPPYKTPFELWFGYKPNLSHLRPFGSHCTARILSNTLSKFDSRGEPGRFLGYAKDAKGYLIWVPGPSGQGGVIKTRRDVTFHDFPPQPTTTASHHDLTPLWDDVTDRVYVDSSPLEHPSVPSYVRARAHTMKPSLIMYRCFPVIVFAMLYLGML